MSIESINQPLVSIIVITYNSALYVLETLESAKKQTYQNIELIVSDDCSTDNTEILCKNWLTDNHTRFAGTKLITTKKNTGIPSNCNRGANASTGKWIKFIAGDDLLSSKYFEILLSYVFQSEYNIKALCSNHFIFQDKNTSFEKKTNFQSTNYFLESNIAYDQFQFALRSAGTVPALTAFINRELFNQIKGFDEEYKYLEDYPFFLKINQIGEKVYLVNNPLAYYRKHDCNITKIQDSLINVVYKNVLEVKYNYCRKHLPPIEKLGVTHEYIITNFLMLLANKHNSLLFLCKFLFKYQIFINPFFIYRNSLKILGKKYKYQKYMNNIIP
ncbi:MAG TPA: glycosyltransferase [Paludibacter sp.]